MIVLKVIAAVLLFIFFLSLVNLKVKIIVTSGKFIIKAYFGIIGKTVFTNAEKDKTKKIKKEKKKKNDETDLKDDEKNKKKKSIKENINNVKDLIAASKKTLNIIRHHLFITQIYTDISVGGEDAHKTALNYANHVTLITNALFYLRQIVVIKIKKIKIEPNFLSEQTVYNAKCLIKIRTFWVIVGAVYLIISIIKNTSLLKRKGGKKHEPATAN